MTESMSFSREDAEEYTASLEQVLGGSWRQIAWAQRVGIPEALGMTTKQWVTERIGNYVKLSVPERKEAVKELAAEGMTEREIAGVLGIGKTAVHRDITNGKSGPNGPSDEDEWQEPPLLFSIVDTQTGEIIHEVADLAAARTAKSDADLRDFVDSLPSESKAALVEMERSTLPEIASEQIVSFFRRARLAQHEFERIDPTRLRTIATDRPDVADLLKEGIEVGMSLIAACRRGLPEDGQAIRRLS
jgi:predicted transcriptional regulator